MQRKKRIQTLLIVVPNGTAAGTPIEGQITLDKAYDKCTGLAVSIGNGFAGSGNSYVDCGLRDAYGTIVDDQHMEALQANASVKPDDKYLSVDIDNRNQLLFGRVIPTALTTSQFTVQFRFELTDSRHIVARM